MVNYLLEKYHFQSSTFVAVGFSMGSNILVKYLGEEGYNCRLTAAVSVGNPFDIVKCSSNMRATLFNRMTYDAQLTKNLKKLFFEQVNNPHLSFRILVCAYAFGQSNAHEMFKDHPEIDVEGIKNVKSLREFDDRVTKIAFK